MSIERHLHGTATAVSELWTDENDTHARLAALHERASRETSDQEQPQAATRARRDTSARPSRHAPRRGGERPLSEINFLTVAEVASIMGVSKMSVYRLVHSGHLPAIRVASSFRVPEQAVYDFLRESLEAANVDGL